MDNAHTGQNLERWSKTNNRKVISDTPDAKFPKTRRQDWTEDGIYHIMQDVSNGLLWVFACKARIDCPRSSSSTAVHPQWNLIHPIVVDNLAAQHRRPWFSPAKVRRGIAPEVATVCDDTAREGILRPGSTTALAKAALRRCEEGVQAEKPFPLLEAAMSSTAVGMTGCKGRIGTVSRG